MARIAKKVTIQGETSGKIASERENGQGGVSAGHGMHLCAWV